jgi:hypothetical protein
VNGFFHILDAAQKAHFVKKAVIDGDIQTFAGLAE